jgi:hypothetical protein
MLLQDDEHSNPGDAALFAGVLSLLELLKIPVADLDAIKGSDFMGMDCTGAGDQCSNSQMCCTNNYFVSVWLAASSFWLTLCITRMAQWPLAVAPLMLTYSPR